MKSISIIYEDSRLLVLNKPAGIMTHGDGRSDEPTLADWVLKRYPKMESVGEPWQFQGKSVPRPGIVHRLDRDTSGVMILAKDQKTFDFLKKQFQGRDAKKTYIAFVHGSVKEDEGTIDRPLGRSKSDFRQFSAHATARGELREAVTDYKVIRRFKDKGKDYSYVEAYPRTGRTHQIRAHFKFISHPVVCDALYAGKRGCGLGLSRLALHARELELKIAPKKTMKFKAPLPADLKSVIGKYARLA